MKLARIRAFGHTPTSIMITTDKDDPFAQMDCVYAAENILIVAESLESHIMVST